jgi:esterase/lipase
MHKATPTFHEALNQLEAHQQQLERLGLRAGNEPEVMHHGKATSEVILLIHGLTDSPHFMRAIGRRFHGMGFNVVIPLLPGHGLKRPAKVMNTVRLTDWLSEVEYNVRLAHQLGSRLSIGGLSAGGTLSLHRAMTDPESINGAVFLFSAALNIGPLTEWALSQDKIARVLAFIDQQRAFWKEKRFLGWKMQQENASAQPTYGIGDNPFRYSVIFFNFMTQLVILINQIESRYPTPAQKYADVQHDLFIAHSRADKTARIQELEHLYEHRLPSTHARFYRLNDVPHASVVLEEAIRSSAGNKVLEQANPQFDDMMHAVEAFVQEALLKEP